MKKLILTIFIISFFPILCLSDTILWQKNLAARTFEFHPNNNYLAVDYGLGITLRDVLTGEEIRKVIDVKKDGALAMNFSKDGKYLACGSGSGRIWVWDTETWEERVVDEIPGGLTNITGILSIQFSPDGKFLAAAASNYGMVIYETTTWKRIDKWNGFPSIGGGLLASATNVSFRFDSKALAITSNQANKVFLYDINAKQPYDSLYGASAQFSPVRNELLVIKVIKSNGNYINDGLNYYKFDISNQPEHLALGVLQFNFTNDGNYIVRFGEFPANVDIIDIKNKVNKYNFKYIDDFSFGY